NSVAEFDDALDRYFIETEAFRGLAGDKADIIAGDKGTGKTALYKVFAKRYTGVPSLKQVEVVPGFNPVGNPVFQRLAQVEALSEGQYITVWKSYFLSLAGNWLLQLYGADVGTETSKLDTLLQRAGLRSQDDSAETVFSKIISLLSRFAKPKSVQMGFTFSEAGIPVVTPKVEFGAGEQGQEKQEIAHEEGFTVLNRALDEVDLTVWLALDRLDEAFQGFPNVETPALRALFRTYLDLLAYPRVRLKLFVRNDVFRKVVQGGFVNLTHINARKMVIVWEEDDLLNLFARRVRDSSEFLQVTELTRKSDREIFDRIFPDQVVPGGGRPKTWNWMMSRIRDGNGIKPPRNLIDLIVEARQAQLRSEDRSPREQSPELPIIEGDAIRRAQRALSERRVQDTLFAEASDLAPTIEKFRDGKAEHSVKSLSELLGLPEQSVRAAIKPLLEIGFLEEVGSSFKVPMLYRDGLNITQGKAFGSGETEEEE
ncbi:MAG TPA: hypothetical protein VEI55_05985, partial [Candidatus Acidoferrum sp.]|nr:hypothetical protein [Candidatus Acidoferrum sp.]